jgi:5-hydroxyisourate hydrolase
VSLREPANMGKLTTHVLDTHAGIPAARIRIALYAVEANGRTLISDQATGTDGRLPAPLLEGEPFRCGRYEIVFGIADYFRARGVALPDPAFVEEARISIGIASPDQHYHVPLLITPWSYSVYRGG